MATKTAKEMPSVTKSGKEGRILRHVGAKSPEPVQAEQAKPSFPNRSTPNYLKPTLISDKKTVNHSDLAQKPIIQARKSFEKISPPAVSRVIKSPASAEQKEKTGSGSRDRSVSARGVRSNLPPGRTGKKIVSDYHTKVKRPASVAGKDHDGEMAPLDVQVGDETVAADEVKTVNEESEIPVNSLHLQEQDVGEHPDRIDFAVAEDETVAQSRTTVKYADNEFTNQEDETDTKSGVAEEEEEDKVIEVDRQSSEAKGVEDGCLSGSLDGYEADAEEILHDSDGGHESVSKQSEVGGEESTTMAAPSATGRKETPAAYNDVIEETKNKLMESKKNKVKALVGAFETVIDYETNSK